MIFRSTKALHIILAVFAAAGTAGCFTGVESTPRISDSDVKRSQASGVTAEQVFLTDIVPLPPAQWSRGRELLVARDRIGLIFTNASDIPEHLEGEVIRFDGFTPARTLTGDDATEAVFTTVDGRRLHYRLPATDAQRIDTLSELAVPFTIDLDVVRRIDSRMRGQHYFVRTPAWYTTADRQPTAGLRHVEVTIDSVGPGDENFVAAVYFTVTDQELRNRVCADGANRMVLMSLGSGRAATRNFDTLFSFNDPRKQYPEIKDDVWQLIITSKVREGMSRDECRLALGAPPAVERIPTYGGMRERWSYTDGVYLIFDDGYLTRYRL